MTREEAIAKFEKQLTSAMVVLDSGFGTRPGESDRVYRERKELAEIALSALRQQEQTPCSKCGYGGKHLDAPPCTTCPAHPKGQSQNETVTKCHDLYDEDGGEILLKPSEMTLDDAIAHLDDTLSDTDRKWSCESCRLEHMQLRSWLAELRDIKQNQNEPLTLDELRQMAGEPVWLHTFSPVQKKTNVAQWSILETVGSANATFLRAGVNSRLTKWFCNYGERWLAYRQKPEEGTV